MLLLRELWRDIPDYEGLYQVSNIGNVRSLNYGGVNGKVKRLKPGTNKGYKKVVLYKEGKSKTYSVHRLVAEAFIPNPNNLPYVNHKDENKTNNTTWNLEWCTHEYNLNYGTRNERISKAITGENNRLYGKHLTQETKQKISKVMRIKVKCVELNKIFDSQIEANEYFNKDKYNSSISMCLTGKQKTAFGYHWEYVNKEEMS